MGKFEIKADIWYMVQWPFIQVEPDKLSSRRVLVADRSNEQQMHQRKKSDTEQNGKKREG
jgi:hypothetical protein